MGLKKIVLWCLFVVAMFFLGCTKKHQTPNPLISKKKEVANHIDVSTSMKSIMYDMEDVLYERYKSELERDEARVRYAYKLSGKLISMSEQIKKYSQETSFINYANQLGVHGKKIEKFASKYRMKDLEIAVLQTKNICNSCHKTFNKTISTIR